jgi:hypothetical protein
MPTTATQTGPSLLDRIKHLDGDLRKCRLRDAQNLWPRPTAGAFIAQRLRDYRNRTALVEALARDRPDLPAPPKVDAAAEVFKDIKALPHLAPPLSPQMARWRAAIIGALRADRDMAAGALEQFKTDCASGATFAGAGGDPRAFAARRTRELESALAAVQARLDRLEAAGAAFVRINLVETTLDPGKITELLAPSRQVDERALKKALEAPALHREPPEPESFMYRTAAEAVRLARADVRARQEAAAAALVNAALSGDALAILDLSEQLKLIGVGDLALSLNQMCGTDEQFLAVIRDQFEKPGA